MTLDVKRSIESWQRELQMPVTILTKKDVPKTTATRLLAARSTQALSDWVRLWILHAEGGLWIDATFLVNNGAQLLDLMRRAKETDALLFGYSSWGLQTDRRFPVIESWLLGAPKESPLVLAWLQEFELAAQMGFRQYRLFIESQGIDPQNIYTCVGNEYLTIHATLQAVLQRNPILREALCLELAERGPLQLQVNCGWKSVCIGRELADRADLYPMIKIRGADRKYRDNVQAGRKGLIVFLVVFLLLLNL